MGYARTAPAANAGRIAQGPSDRRRRPASRSTGDLHRSLRRSPFPPPLPFLARPASRFVPAVLSFRALEPSRAKRRSDARTAAPTGLFSNWRDPVDVIGCHGFGRMPVLKGCRPLPFDLWIPHRIRQRLRISKQHQTPVCPMTA